VVPSSTTADAKILNAVCRRLSLPQRTYRSEISLFIQAFYSTLFAFVCLFVVPCYCCCFCCRRRRRRRRCCRSSSAPLVAYELAYELSITLLWCYSTHHRALFNAHIVLAATLLPGLQRNCLSLISSDGYSRWTRDPARGRELAGDPRLPH
jgi:hypothetical protein